MAIPDYQTVMLPLLRFLKDEKEHNIGEVVDALAEEFGLSAEERQQLLGSGQQTVIRNRAGWARTYLKKAGLIASTRRGFFRITERGQSVLVSNAGRIDVKFLEQFPSLWHSESFAMSGRTKRRARALPRATPRQRRLLTRPTNASDSTWRPTFSNK